MNALNAQEQTYAAAVGRGSVKGPRNTYYKGRAVTPAFFKQQVALQREMGLIINPETRRMEDLIEEYTDPAYNQWVDREKEANLENVKKAEMKPQHVSDLDRNTDKVFTDAKRKITVSPVEMGTWDNTDKIFGKEKRPEHILTMIQSILARAVKREFGFIKRMPLVSVKPLSQYDESTFPTTMVMEFENEADVLNILTAFAEVRTTRPYFQVKIFTHDETLDRYEEIEKFAAKKRKQWRDNHAGQEIPIRIFYRDYDIRMQRKEEGTWYNVDLSHISTPFYWSMDDCTIPFERLKWHQKRVYIKQLIERGTHIPEDVQRSVFKAKKKSKPDDQNSVDSGEFLNQPYYAPGPLFGNAAAVQAFHNPFPATDPSLEKIYSGKKRH